MNTTLTDLKRLLDQGETLVNDFGSLMWKAAQPDMYFVNHAMFSWEDIVLYSNPSLWHQRDRIGAEKPAMMAVPIDEWNALQEELRELRELRKLKEDEQDEPNPEYEYEMFFKSEPTDACKIDGWYPIATDRIRNPDKIDQYIKNGLLRKL